jgi:hypothetical protein
VRQQIAGVRPKIFQRLQVPGSRWRNPPLHLFRYTTPLKAFRKFSHGDSQAATGQSSYKTPKIRLLQRTKNISAVRLTQDAVGICGKRLKLMQISFAFHPKYLSEIPVAYPSQRR